VINLKVIFNEQVAVRYLQDKLIKSYLYWSNYW